MRMILTVFALLLVMPAQAQVTEVTSERIAFSLPDGKYDYPRDIIALKDSVWAQENVQLAFMLSGDVEVPPVASDSLIQALTDAVNDLIAERDSLLAANADLESENDSLAVSAALYDDLAAAVRSVIDLARQ